VLDKIAMEKGMRYAFVGQSVGILLAMLLQRTAFGPLFLKHLGASDTLVMWVFAAPGLLPFVQIPLSLRVPPNRTKQALLVFWALWAASMLAVAFLPDLLDNPKNVLLATVTMLVIAIFVNMAAGTFWFPLLSDVIPKDMRGRFFGRLRATWTALLYLTTILTGLYLGPHPEYARFRNIVLFGVSLIILRNIIVSKVQIPAPARTDASDYKDWQRYLKAIFGNNLLRNFFIYYTLFGSAAGILAQPLVLYMNTLGINPRDNLIIFGTSTLGMVVVLLMGGRVIDKIGTRHIFKAVHWTLVATLLSTTVVTYLPRTAIPAALVLVFMISGATIALSNLACTTHLFAFIPQKGKVFYLSFSNLMLTIGPSITFFLTGMLLKVVPHGRLLSVSSVQLNIFQVMLIGALLVSLAATPLLRKISAPHENHIEKKR
jgi:MFS family permease